jgi:predicted methyltransferase
VPSQRAKNKKVISVPMEDDLIAAIEQFAATKGWDRVQAIKFKCRKVLGLKMPKD